MGLGSRIVQAVMRAVAGADGRTVQLGGLEHNAVADRFWRRHGFAELRRQPYTSASDYESQVIVMRHHLG